MKELKAGGVAVYHIAKNNKIPFTIKQDKEELVLYLPQNTDSVVKNIFITDFLLIQ